MSFCGWEKVANIDEISSSSSLNAQSWPVLTGHCYHDHWDCGDHSGWLSAGGKAQPKTEGAESFPAGFVLSPTSVKCERKTLMYVVYRALTRVHLVKSTK